MRNLLAAALMAVGLTNIANAVRGAADDNPETVAGTVASSTELDVQARVATRIAAHPILNAAAAAGIDSVDKFNALLVPDPVAVAAKAAGIDSVEKVKTMSAEAVVGASHLVDLRTEVKALANSALTPAVGVTKEEMIDAADYSLLQTLKAGYDSAIEAQGLHGVNGAGAVRQTAPNQIDIAAGTAGGAAPKVMITSSEACAAMEKAAKA